MFLPRWNISLLWIDYDWIFHMQQPLLKRREKSNVSMKEIVTLLNLYWIIKTNNSRSVSFFFYVIYLHVYSVDLLLSINCILENIYLVWSWKKRSYHEKEHGFSPYICSSLHPSRRAFFLHDRSRDARSLACVCVCALSLFSLSYFSDHIRSETAWNVSSMILLLFSFLSRFI